MRSTRFTPPGLRRKPERFANDGRAGEVFLREGAVGLKDQGDGFAQVLPGLVEGRALRIGSGQFLDEGDKPFGDFAIHGGEFDGDGRTRVGGPRNVRPLSPRDRGPLAKRGAPPMGSVAAKPRVDRASGTDSRDIVGQVE